MIESSYRELRGRLRTGDVVLMSGRGIESAATMLATGSPWTHVGQLVVVEPWDLVLLWEAAQLPSMVEVVTGRTRRAVHLSPLSEVLRNHRGRVALRQLNRDLPADMLDALQRFRRDVQTKPYEGPKVDLLKAAWSEPMVGQDLSALFGPELLAEAWMAIGLLGRNRPAGEYTAKTFATGGGLVLRHGFELAAERGLKT